MCVHTEKSSQCVPNTLTRTQNTQTRTSNSSGGDNSRQYLCSFNVCCIPLSHIVFHITHHSSYHNPLLLVAKTPNNTHTFHLLLATSLRRRTILNDFLDLPHLHSRNSLALVDTFVQTIWGQNMHRVTGQFIHMCAFVQRFVINISTMWRNVCGSCVCVCEFFLNIITRFFFSSRQ